MNQIDFRSLQPQWQKDPELCAHTLFLNKGERLTTQQRGIINSTFANPETYAKSAHGLGKTRTAALTALCFLYAFYPSKVITTAPSWEQVAKLLWSEIRTIWKNSRAHKYGFVLSAEPSLTELKLADDWFATGMSPRIDNDDPGGRATGFHSENILFIMDEGPAVNPKIWTIKDTLLTSANPHFLAIGNPVESSGPFYIGFQDPQKHKITLDIFESPNFIVNGITDFKELRKLSKLTTDEQEKAFAKMKYPFPALTTPRWAVQRLIDWGADSPLFISRVLAKFPGRGAQNLISLADLEACKTSDGMPGPRVLGCDIARYGDDSIVYFGLSNFKEVLREKHHYQDTVETSSQIVRIARRDQYEIIVIDEGGLGAGVVDQVRAAFDRDPHPPTIIGVNFGGKPTESSEYEKNCADKVTEMFLRANELIKTHFIQLKDDGNLFAQLVNRKYKESKGKMRMESKQEYKDRTAVGSPDEADACLLAIYGATAGAYQSSVTATEERKIGGDW